LPVVITLTGWITADPGAYLPACVSRGAGSLFEKINFGKFFAVAFAITLCLGLYLTKHSGGDGQNVALLPFRLRRRGARIMLVSGS
jgi:hypothetical protein